VGFLGRGQQSPLHTSQGVWGAVYCKLPQRGPGQSPGDQQIFRILVCPERLSYATWGHWACVRPPPDRGIRGVLPPALLICVDTSVLMVSRVATVRPTYGRVNKLKMKTRMGKRKKKFPPNFIKQMFAHPAGVSAKKALRNVGLIVDTVTADNCV